MKQNSAVENAFLEKINQHVQDCDPRVPFYAFDLDAFRKRIKDIQKILHPAELVYAVKANPFLIKTADKACRWFEVCSSGELEQCVMDGVDPSKVVYTGVLKTKEDVDFALSIGVGVISAESMHQLEFIDTWASKSLPDYKINVILRRTSGDQFGMNDEEIENILKQQKFENKWTFEHFCGLQFFSGTQKKIEKTLEEIDDLTRFADYLENKVNWKPDYLEFGGCSD